jgi:taurine--2-oxoglutarate transaminase
VPFNAGGPAAKPMTELVKFCLSKGLYLFTHWNKVMVVPPLVITPEEARQGIAILDEALEITDRAAAAG